jgi:hypothetical protein
VTPYELLLGLNAIEWNNSFINSVLTNISSEDFDSMMERTLENCLEQNIDDESCDYYTEKYGSIISSNKADINSSNLNENHSVSENEVTKFIGRDVVRFESIGSEYLQNREYQGLIPSISEDHSIEIVYGTFGIAADYQQIYSTSNSNGSTH